MNWFEKILPPKIQNEPRETSVPEGLWCKCDGCREIMYYTDLENNLQVCIKCGFHHSISARIRISMLLDNIKEEIGNTVLPRDALNFNDSKLYADRLLQAQSNVNESEALVVVRGDMQDSEVVLATFEFKFMGGSMGSVVGERFALGIDAAIEHKCPFICVTSSGGARMQEGVYSLMQMAKTVAALSKLDDAGLPSIMLLTHPTMGGVSASFVFLGDVVIAEPGALIGFAGPRVIEQTVRKSLPAGFQTSEFLLRNGAIDMIVDRRDLKRTIIRLLDYMK